MTKLQRKALAITPLTEDKIEEIYNNHSGINGSISGLSKFVQKLCESHERLRMELQGAEKLLADNAKPKSFGRIAPEEMRKMALEQEKNLIDHGDALNGDDWAMMQIVRAYLAEHPEEPVSV